MSQLEKLIERLKHARTEVAFRDLCKVLETAGYSRVRQKGSHVHFRKTGSTSFTVPVHDQKVKAIYVKQIITLLSL